MGDLGNNRFYREPPAENTPHTHGGTDAPECTRYGIPCQARICPCGCPDAMHIGEIGCPCALPGEPPCSPRDTPTDDAQGGRA